uniref:Uncharacterized protein n=1 Tax=Siphoviridae sp. ctVJE9 TaxID=2825530 RepID=A0A8S5TUM3_9CAUD|nr:MAG TPA: hypothetical protein [Siphoviridae sp. ctVJE9]
MYSSLGIIFTQSCVNGVIGKISVNLHPTKRRIRR